MKKKIVVIWGVLFVLGAVFVSFKYFRGSETPADKADTQDQYKNMADSIVSEDSLHIPAQEGEISEENRQLAASLKKTTGMEYNPLNITTIGKPIRTGEFSYQINAWSMSKEYPGYPVPGGQESLEERTGAQLDEAGNIINDYSYVVVNMEVENMTSNDIKYLIWGIFQLKSIGSGTGQYCGEVLYLGDNRPMGKDYYLDTIEANSKKEMPMIFVVKDEYVNDNQLYIEVNPSGVATNDPDYDVKRYIFLD